MLRFAGFELDPQRAELRGPNGDIVKLRPKSFDLLQLFASRPGRALSKQELFDAAWPNVHVGDDSLFQCIREIRTALGDERRQLLKLVSGRGYMLDAEVSTTSATEGPPRSEPSEPPQGSSPKQPDASAHIRPQARFGRAAASITVATLTIVASLVAAAPILRSQRIFAPAPPSLVAAPILAAAEDPEVAQMAANVTGRLTDGLAKIDTLRVAVPPPDKPSGSAAAPGKGAPLGDFALNGELQKSARSWEIRARMTETATSEVQWTTSSSIDAEVGDLSLRQSRLAARIGYPVAMHLNARLNLSARPVGSEGDPASVRARLVIEQAAAFINQTTPERFQAAQSMLEKALAADPDNIDLMIALAAHLLRGVQLAWYDRADVAAAQRSARVMVERALRAKPLYIPVLDAYCRLLTATNQFLDSLIACARALTSNPWDGVALFHLGITQVQLGRFEEALATFEQADRFGTPEGSRWLWPLGAGWSCILMGRDEEALTWLRRSLAITPGTGRTHFLLAVAYERLGHPTEAREAVARGLELRPGSTAANVSLPTENTSPIYLEASRRVSRALIEAGLPER